MPHPELMLRGGKKCSGGQKKILKPPLILLHNMRRWGVQERGCKAVLQGVQKKNFASHSKMLWLLEKIKKKPKSVLKQGGQG